MYSLKSNFIPVLYAGLIIVALLPLFTHAQSADLRATIEQSLRQDPRTANLTQVQVDAMVDSLMAGASQQRITAEDITWRPQITDSTANVEAGTPVSMCERSDFLCMSSEAFGFIGLDTTIPFTLGAASMGLIWIFAEMLHRRKHHLGA